MRNKADRAEAGIAYFPGPSPSGREAAEYPFDDAFDGAFGHGATAMLVHATRAIQSASDGSGIPLLPCIGLGARPRSALDTIELAWLVHARDVYCLKTVASEEDPIWAALRSTGIREVFHLPSVPAEIREDQLPMAKPGAG